jgi:hypothetical protein
MYIFITINKKIVLVRKARNAELPKTLKTVKKKIKIRNLLFIKVEVEHF